MRQPGIAVKALIVNKAGEILIIKREINDSHKPGTWDFPGGRLEPGENPFEGLMRETMEETGLDIEVKNPLNIHHFTRDDGQVITMITFLCIVKADEVVLSREHTEFAWLKSGLAIPLVHEAFQKDIRNYAEFFSRESES